MFSAVTPHAACRRARATAGGGERAGGLYRGRRCRHLWLPRCARGQGQHEHRNPCRGALRPAPPRACRARALCGSTCALCRATGPAGHTQLACSLRAQLCVCAQRQPVRTQMLRMEGFDNTAMIQACKVGPPRSLLPLSCLLSASCVSDGSPCPFHFVTAAPLEVHSRLFWTTRPRWCREYTEGTLADANTSCATMLCGRRRQKSGR